MKGRYSTRWWRGLTKNERRHLVGLMTAHGGGMGGYLPDDCSECTYCGQPILGYPSLCRGCYNDYKALHDKADAKIAPQGVTV